MRKNRKNRETDIPNWRQHLRLRPLADLHHKMARWAPCDGEPMVICWTKKGEELAIACEADPLTPIEMTPVQITISGQPSVNIFGDAADHRDENEEALLDVIETLYHNFWPEDFEQGRS
jgi:hypothetical protein